MRKLLFLGFFLLTTAAFAQRKKAAKTLLCDTVTGLCLAPAVKGKSTKAKTLAVSQHKPVTIVYFTDPICSTCWGIEPQLRRLKLEYGHFVHVEYRMGGLLPKWEGFNGGGITKPGDVAHHWDEVSRYYEMPIDGDGWLSDPLPSSYPPGIAFKAAQFQGEEKAQRFLRAMKEAVFLQKQNIARWPVQAGLAAVSGLDTNLLKKDMSGRGKAAFEADLAMAKAQKVRGFPTLFVQGNDGSRVTVYGFKPYADFEAALRAVQGMETLRAAPVDTSVTALFAHYPSLTAKELSIITGVSTAQAEARLQQLEQEGRATVVRTKNGHLWRWKPADGKAVAQRPKS